MTTDTIIMSAGIADHSTTRSFYVAFDRRIPIPSVLEFVGRTAAELIDGAEAKMIIERAKEETPRGTTAVQADHGQSSSERDFACDIANKGLDHADANLDDPDSDHITLCRQHLRALEKIARLSRILDALLVQSDERNSLISGYTIENLTLEAADKWPMPWPGGDE